MILNDHDVHFLDVVGLLDDPGLELRDRHVADGIHLELNMMLTELQSLPATVATDYMATFMRTVDADFDGVRADLIRRLHAIDLVQGETASDAVEHMRLLRSVKAQTERIERFVVGDAVTGRSITGRRSIDAEAYYGYADAAELLGVSETTLYRRRMEGRLRAVVLGRRVNFLGRDLLGLCNDQEGEIHILRCE